MSDTDTTGTVQVRTVGPVTIVTIDRPEARNAVDRPTAAALHQAFQAFDLDPDQSVAVLTGAGGTFCSGADLGAIAAGRGNRVLEDQDEPGPMGPTRLQLSKPVIAAVEGYAVAGGIELAIWCDLRVAAHDAVFGVYCRRWGVPLIDGGAVRLPRLIGQSHAMDLILTGRGVSGDEARSMGLVNRLCEPGAALDTAVELATHLSSFPQLCMRNDRHVALAQWDLPHVDAMRLETQLGLDSVNSEETAAAVGRFVGGEGRGGSGV